MNITKIAWLQKHSPGFLLTLEQQAPALLFNQSRGCMSHPAVLCSSHWAAPQMRVLSNEDKQSPISLYTQTKLLFLESWEQPRDNLYKNSYENTSLRGLLFKQLGNQEMQSKS